jgi:hypothetical protein
MNNFSPKDIENLQKFYPDAFLRLDFLKAKREAQELKIHAGNLQNELNQLKNPEK